MAAAGGGWLFLFVDFFNGDSELLVVRVGVTGFFFKLFISR